MAHPPTAPEVDSGETQLRNQGCFGVLGGTRHGLGGVGSGSAVGLACRRSRPPSKLTGWYGWDGRYRTAGGLATHFARCFARPQLCHRQHQGACGETCASTSTGGRRLDERLEHQTQHGDSSPTGPAISPEPSYRTQAAGSRNRSGTTGHRPGTVRSRSGPATHTPSRPTRPPRHPTPNHSQSYGRITETRPSE